MIWLRKNWGKRKARLVTVPRFGNFFVPYFQNSKTGRVTMYFSANLYSSTQQQLTGNT